MTFSHGTKIVADPVVECVAHGAEVMLTSGPAAHSAEAVVTPRRAGDGRSIEVVALVATPDWWEEIARGHVPRLLE
jgi:hypothetical protein